MAESMLPLAGLKGFFLRLQADDLRPRLRDYLTRSGIEITSDDYVPCQNPGHNDSPPYENAHIANDEYIHCFVCAMNYDVFEVDQWLRGSADFPTVLQRVADTVGASVGEPVKRHTKKEREAPIVVPVTNEDARRIFSDDALMKANAWKAEFDDKKYFEKHGKKHETPSVGWGTRIAGKWAARNEQGLVEVVDVRFERGMAPENSARSDNAGNSGIVKNVISFYYNGQYIQTKNAPVVLFGRDELSKNPDWPICFHEGAKCRAAAKAIAGIVPLSWNRGVESVDKFDLGPVTARIRSAGGILVPEAYYYPDNDEPGFKAARNLARRLEAEARKKESGPEIESDSQNSKELQGNHSSRIQKIKICRPATGVFGDGSDIVDALKEKTPDEMREWILNGPEISMEELDALIAGWEERDRKKRERPKNVEATERRDNDKGIEKRTSEHKREGPGRDQNGNVDDKNDYPFRPLGVADDGFAYFLDCSARLKKYRLDTLTSTKMLDLAPLTWWITEFPNHKGGVDWQESTDFVIRISQAQEFDPENRRGRGAWRERDGRICYHDGHQTIGDPDDRRLYLKKTVYDVGLHKRHATFEERKKFLEAVSAMTFETKADTTRALAWSLLAPFGGCLPWRNAMVLTGESKSGKSTLLLRVIMPLVATPYYLSGGTSEAGVRQKTGLDSLPVIIDEANIEGKKGQEMRQGLFALMQQSTSDDAPQVAKGTPNGEGALSYLMRNMFLFSAVTPATGNVEQDNRIMSVNLVPGDPSKWETISDNLAAAVTDDVCAGIRAFTWSKMPEILAAANVMTRSIVAMIQDSRRGYADALLFAAFWRVFKDRIPAEDEFADWLGQVYKVKPLEDKRDETEEMLDKLLDQVTKISGDPKTELTLREILRGIKYGVVEKQTGENRELGLSGRTETRNLEYTELDNWRTTAVNRGVMVDKKSGCLVVKANSDYISKVWDMSGRTYSKLLKRSSKYWKYENFARLGASVWIREIIWDDEVGI